MMEGCIDQSRNTFMKEHVAEAIAIVRQVQHGIYCRLVKIAIVR